MVLCLQHSILVLVLDPLESAYMEDSEVKVWQSGRIFGGFFIHKFCI